MKMLIGGPAGTKGKTSDKGADKPPTGKPGKDSKSS